MLWNSKSCLIYCHYDFKWYDIPRCRSSSLQWTAGVSISLYRTVFEPGFKVKCHNLTFFKRQWVAYIMNNTAGHAVTLMLSLHIRISQIALHELYGRWDAATTDVITIYNQSSKDHTSGFTHFNLFSSDHKYVALLLNILQTMVLCDICLNVFLLWEKKPCALVGSVDLHQVVIILPDEVLRNKMLHMKWVQVTDTVMQPATLADMKKHTFS